MVTRRETLRLGAGTVAVTTFVAGCLGDDDGADDAEDDADDTNGEPDADINVGMVYAMGGLGDQSFSDAAHRGIENAAEDFDVEYQNSEPESPEDFERLQRQFATTDDPDYDLIVCVGFDQTDALNENAENFPDQNFLLIDSVVEADNVASYLFKEHEGSFLMGVMAGHLTAQEFSAGPSSTDPDEQVVGFIGGMQVAVVERFEAGFAAGAQHVDSDIEVRSGYVGSFDDPATAEDISQSMIDEGADVLYHAAGGGGEGVFKAAYENEIFAIGIDSDQSETVPEYSEAILASMVKGVDTAVYQGVEDIDADSFEGALHELGIEEDGINIVWGADRGDDIPDDVLDAIEDAEQAIADGEVDVPAEP